MPNYYIFGSKNIHINMNIPMNIVQVKIENSYSNFTIEEFEKAAEDLVEYLRHLKEWKKE